MLKIAIENAGATRGVLIEERQGELFIAAEGTADADEVVLLRDTPLASGAPLCSSAVVNYVHRTQAGLVIADAVQDERFAQDGYVASMRPRSILCLPIVHQGKLGAILYLENNLTQDAFTPERIEVMRIISAQAAISLENARLFDLKKQENEQRQRAEDALKLALAEVEQLKNQLLEENVYLRGDLIANVSHDLRTPLALLRGYLETLLMKEDSLTAKRRRTYLEIAARQSKHLSTLVSELFELARLDFKGFQISPETFQLGELAQDVLKKFELAGEKKGISLEAEIRPALPFVRGDIGLIERVLDNLIDNAFKYTPAGGKISLSLVPKDGQVEVKVSDTGTGIPADEIPHIFERFYRADKSRTAYSQGAGLGLAIAQRIVNLHGSEIAVESTPKAGTSFSFALPVAA